MAKKPKIPSLQHLARNWHPTPVKIQKELVSIVKHSPNFTYAPLYGMVADMLVFNQPYDQIVKGIQIGIKREDVRARYLELVPLVHDHFLKTRPTFVHAVSRRFYPIGKDLMIPFDPPLVYGAHGKLFFPWFSFWRSNPLTGKSLALFASITKQILAQDPDLENVKFEILDFSAPSANQPRVLQVIDANTIPLLSVEEIGEMLSIFLEGYALAEQELAQMPASTDKETDETSAKSNQLSLTLDVSQKT